MSSTGTKTLSMEEKNYSRILEQEAAAFRQKAHPPSAGEVAWSCPSNIAIVKYWGKRPVQLPMNPSLSLTLREAVTVTRLQYRYDPETVHPGITFTFKGDASSPFGDRVTGFIGSLEKIMPCLAHTRLHITSENNFPHSSGIASSASGMAALSMCLVSLEGRIRGTAGQPEMLKKASFLARLGSGSACRSIYPGFVLWGASDAWPGSSDEFAIPVTGFHPSFRGIRDAILIIEPGQKKVSSSTGHRLMDTNPYAQTRFQQARTNLSALKPILSEGSWDGFIGIMEEEALSLHAMMMTSRPGYLLMEPGTLSILNAIRKYRNETGTRLGFTLDAGANVHLLYDAVQEGMVNDFIDTELKRYCENNRVIRDRMGDGPVESA
jgi:diphosphomevalonate decarboxylase